MVIDRPCKYGRHCKFQGSTIPDEQHVDMHVFRQSLVLITFAIYIMVTLLYFPSTLAAAEGNKAQAFAAPI